MAFGIMIAGPLLSLILGILILAYPKFLRYFLGIYFLLIGILGLISF